MKVPRIARYAALALFLVLALLALVVWSKWRRHLAPVDRSARPYVSAVLRAYYSSKVTGAYWENEVEEQAEVLAKRSQEDRVAFFRGVLLNCPLEAASSMTFVEAVGTDAQALHDDLDALKRSPLAKELTDVQRERLGLWLTELPVIVEQQQ